MEATNSRTARKVMKKLTEARNSRRCGRSGILWWITRPSLVKCKKRRITAMNTATKMRRIHDPGICITKYANEVAVLAGKNHTLQPFLVRETMLFERENGLLGVGLTLFQINFFERSGSHGSDVLYQGPTLEAAEKLWFLKGTGFS